jgi:hypothetical protein
MATYFNKPACSIPFTPESSIHKKPKDLMRALGRGGRGEVKIFKAHPLHLEKIKESTGGGRAMRVRRSFQRAV